jgi:hypothetical protein
MRRRETACGDWPSRNAINRGCSNIFAVDRFFYGLAHRDVAGRSAAKE